jgi:hypothetical protein
MGLDISYYADTRPDPDADMNDWQNVARASVESHHIAQADGIEHGALFRFDKEKSGSFRAGSYSSYGTFRDELAKLAGYPEGEETDFGHRHAAAAWQGLVEPSAPFYPMINFSDCEGVIGPETSARLAQDFAAHQAKADEIGGWFAELYGIFRKAFEAVAGNGFVEFH